MNTTTILTAIAVLILLYPFIVYYQLNTLEKKIDKEWSEIEELLKEEKEKNSDEIHRRRRVYNTLVRENNHRLSSFIARLMSKKYGFKSREFFEFQGR